MYIKIKDRKYVDELKNLDNVAVPKKNIDEWLYDLTKEHNFMLGEAQGDAYACYCTHCHKWTYLDKKPKLKSYLTCNHCHNTFQHHRMKYAHTTPTLEIGYTVLQKVNGIIYSRYFYGSKRISFGSKECDIGVYESKRKRIDNDWTLAYSQFAGKMIPYYPGLRMNYYGYGNDHYENKGWLYSNNIKDMFEDTKYKYSAIELIAGKPVNIQPFLYLEDTSISAEKERLAKIGFACLAVEYTYYSYSNHADLLQILRNEMRSKFKWMIKANVSFRDVETIKNCNCENEYELKIMKSCRMTKYGYDFTRKYMSHKKLIEYAPQIKHYIEYKDYLGWCDFLGENMSDKKVLFPKNLKKAHDEKMNAFQVVKDEVISKSIAAYAKELNTLKFEDNKYIIRPAQSQEELIKESKELNHCVRDYAEKMAKKQTSIMFIRKKASPNKPLVTLELRNKKIIQVRSKGNGDVPNPIKQFIKQWEKQYSFSGF